MSTLNVDTINGQDLHATGIVSAGSALKAPNYADSGKPSSADPGTVIYNTTGTDVEVWKGSSWLSLGAGNMRTWTTETRPSSPSVAQFGFNTTTSQAEIFNGSDWLLFGSSAEGASAALFDFNTFTFKSIVGRGSYSGPSSSQMQSEYGSEAWNDGTYFKQGASQGFQKWTVPEDGTYEIECGGARGGRDLGGGQYDFWGAIIKGDFALTKETELEMVVGVGGNQYYSPHRNSCGGGGGTFVKNATTNQQLIIAGGGGGSMGGSYGWGCGRPTGHSYGRSGEYGGRLSCYCQPSQPSPGNGGSRCGPHVGGAGGGYNTNGQDGSGHCGGVQGGRSWNNGMIGGRGDHCYSPSNGQGNSGGFGGGGGGNLTSPGAAGGWTGGCTGGSWSSYGHCGGGGGSYNSGQAAQNTEGGNSGTTGGQYQGNGYIKITKK